jgi:hypothetical protein
LFGVCLSKDYLVSAKLLIIREKFPTHLVKMKNTFQTSNQQKKQAVSKGGLY